jgi:hypothetical protein
MLSDGSVEPHSFYVQSINDQGLMTLQFSKFLIGAPLEFLKNSIEISIYSPKNSNVYDILYEILEPNGLEYDKIQV